MKKILLTYIPCPSLEEAKSLCNLLLINHLIACGNVFVSESMYKWDGVIIDGGEFILLVKSVIESKELILKTVEENHSYDLPAILQFEVECNLPYFEWVTKNCKIN